MVRLDKLSATQIISLIDQGTVTSRETTVHFIERIRQVNPGLNAVVYPLFEDALQQADQADELFRQGKRTGRLHGFPFTIKECLDLAGTPTTLGIIRRKNDIPVMTDAYVAALQNQGGIILGKTNVPQTLAFFESANPVYGVTNNPFSSTHTCGGSSGGEAAIIAMGGSAVGIGTDLGGSLRVPAAFCGICTIKPTAGRITDFTRYIDHPPNLSIKSVTGILANYAEDLQLFLEILNEVSIDQRQIKPLKNFKGVDITKLKVGYFLSDGLFEPMTAVKRAVTEAVGELKRVGAQVTEFVPPPLSEAEELFFRILSADGAPIYARNLRNEKAMPQGKSLLMILKASVLKRKLLSVVARLFGQKSLTRIIPYFGGKGAAFREEMELKQKAFAAKYEAAMNNSKIGSLDAVISPSCSLPAYLHNTSDKVGLGGAYAIQHNVTGFPAGVAAISKVTTEEAIARKKTMDILVRTAAKIERSSAGLPLGIQIAARPWDEHIVIALINLLHKREI
jgi:fatty acid amide hydrolase